MRLVLVVLVFVIDERAVEIQLFQTVSAVLAQHVSQEAIAEQCAIHGRLDELLLATALEPLERSYDLHVRELQALLRFAVRTLRASVVLRYSPSRRGRQLSLPTY